MKSITDWNDTRKIYSKIGTSFVLQKSRFILRITHQQQYKLWTQNGGSFTVFQKTVHLQKKPGIIKGPIIRSLIKDDKPHSQLLVNNQWM